MLTVVLYFLFSHRLGNQKLSKKELLFLLFVSPRDQIKDVLGVDGAKAD